MAPRPKPEESGDDEKRPHRPVRKGGPSPVGLVLVLVVVVGALALFLSMNKKKAAQARTQDVPAADPFADVPDEAPPPPPSERRKAK
jgi:hypothetical protein